MTGLQDPALCDQARVDYEAYLEENRDDAEKHRDPEGRQFRLTNFHLASDAAMRLAKNPEIMRILDFIFGREATVHTSLTFQYSTMQWLHRDAPYFHTFPAGQFVGVWTALQDIDPKSGPLSYVPGSHRKIFDQHAYYNEALSRTGDPAQARAEALSRYQNEVNVFGETLAPRTYAVLRTGDVGLWHPELIHGGSPAENPRLKRHSMVVHCCPSDVSVFVDDVFLRHQSPDPPAPYYGYSESYGRKHSEFGRPGFMSGI
jgi:ectoine hydroxylase-related dioxygenase (phytanoyl-CoA dioxygenase family)